MYLVTAWQMQQMDKKTIEIFGIPGLVLMENAGRGATKILLSKFDGLDDKMVGIVAGKGNNGGDGFVIARYLALRGINVVVYLLAESSEISGDAKTNLDLLSGLNVPVIEICDQKTLLKHKTAMTNRELWVDAIFGTGLKSEVTGFFRSLIEFINKLEKPVLAVDIPSGLHPDTGQPLGICIEAQVTATFGFAKTGQMVYPGADYCGSIEIVDIGIPPHIAVEALPSTYLLTPETLVSYYRKRKNDAHKGDAGHLMIAAGSTGKSGAAYLAASSAMKTGAGLVTLGIPRNVNPVLETMVPEVMTLPLSETKEGALSKSSAGEVIQALDGKNCLAVGPGIGVDEQTVKSVQTMITESRVPLVVDADGLNCISLNTGVLRNLKAETVLTPHPKEMARLIDSDVSAVQKNRVACAVGFAEKYKVHVVLKGARTVIAHPDGSAYVNPTGNPALASGGTGDVLTGMIAGFISQGYPPARAAHMGVFLHGAAADLLAEVKGPVGILASDIMDVIPELIGDMAEGRLAPIKNLGLWF